MHKLHAKVAVAIAAAEDCADMRPALEARHDPNGFDMTRGNAAGGNSMPGEVEVRRIALNIEPARRRARYPDASASLAWPRALTRRGGLGPASAGSADAQRQERIVLVCTANRWPCLLG